MGRTRPLSIDAVSIGDGLAGVANDVVNLPKLSEDLAPIAAAIPLQWLVWQLAIDRGMASHQTRALNKVTRTQ
jgi:glucosamine 6-phosphate synthetase-like amidotransferase/phosphosugar isomerase protein